MEVKIKQVSTESPSLVASKRSSIFESDQVSFSRWLSGSPSDSLKNRWRADMPQPLPAAHGTLQEKASQEHSSSSGPLADSIDGVSFSRFGHCAPLATTPVDSDVIDEKQWIVGRERLVRLLAAQQAWYDAQKEACMQASAILELLEHHQTQWLQSTAAEM
ncbi:MAG: hypothetical protein NTY42_15550 [Planctomycetota bacterium]|nr:hypothetical protein [Planctomycetota bacterium]